LNHICRSRDVSWRCVGFIPELNTPGLLTDDEARSYRLKYYLDMIRTALDPIARCYREGGFLLTLQGEEHHFIPAIAIVIQDSKEVSVSNYYICNVTPRHKHHFACRAMLSAARVWEATPDTLVVTVGLPENTLAILEA